MDGVGNRNEIRCFINFHLHCLKGKSRSKRFRDEPAEISV